MKNFKFEESVGYVMEKDEYTHEMNAKEITEAFKTGTIRNEVFFKTTINPEHLEDELGWEVEDLYKYSIVEIRYNGKEKDIELLLTNPENNECLTLASGWSDFGDDEGVFELFNFLIENDYIEFSEGAIDYL